MICCQYPVTDTCKIIVLLYTEGKKLYLILHIKHNYTYYTY